MALDYEITAIRLEPAPDREHLHIALVGYESPHVPDEAVTIDIARALQKMAFDESFHITVDGERVEVKQGKCPVCGEEPYLVTAADSGDDQKLFALPRE